jgi:hypothetical protein
VPRPAAGLRRSRPGRPSRTLAAQAASSGTAWGTLAAVNANLPWPGEPHLIGWHAVNVLREQGGDGHIAALQAAGLDPCEALVSFAAIGAAPGDVVASRRWSTQEWSAARDRLASNPRQALGPERAQRLAELARPLLVAAFESALFPAVSTLGIATVPAPADHPGDGSVTARS